jgi:hypothetical protein
MMARPKKVEAPINQAAETDKVEQSSKLRYRVVNSRIGHDIGNVLEYDKEPHVLFLRCLERVE